MRKPTAPAGARHGSRARRTGRQGVVGPTAQPVNKRLPMGFVAVAAGAGATIAWAVLTYLQG